MLAQLLRLLDRIVTLFEEWSLFITVIAALCSLFVNVILRYGFNHSLPWSEELVREVIIYTTFIGCSAAVRRNAQIKVDAAVQIFQALRTPLILISHLATLIFSLLLIHYGWKMAELMVQTGQKTIILQIPLVWLYAILPLTGVLMTFRTLQSFYNDFFNRS
jgi:TRAP-type C4-dicarboxylate transport system permease small subunit